VTDRGGHPSDVSVDLPANDLSLPSRPSTEIDPAEMIGEYAVEERIGRGGMGTVYAAIHPVIGKRVAIKVLRRDLCANADQVERFVQEAQAVNRIGHPNIVDIFSLGELPDGRSYFVMEWLSGEDLGKRLERGRLSLTAACHVLDGLACALAAAHAKGIIHRDLKPDNVFLCDGDPPPIKLLDFGIAKLVGGPAQRLERTRTGSMLGTPRYISPEQARGIAVDGRTDIYSLGVLAYELVVGAPPFDAETAMDIVLLHMTEEARRPSETIALPTALDGLITRMLAKSPADRPTLDEVRAVLANVSAQPAAAWSSPALPRQRRRAVWIAATCAAAAIAGIAVWKLGDSESAPASAAEVKPAPAPPPKSVEQPGRSDEITIAPPASAETAPLAIAIHGGEATIIVDDKQSVVGRSATFEVPLGPHKIKVLAGSQVVTRDVDVQGQKSIAITLPRKVSIPPHKAPPKKPQPETVVPAQDPQPDNPGNGLMKPTHGSASSRPAK
jgi:eukaryotic-like serine/threonine-protein kinase